MKTRYAIILSFMAAAFLAGLGGASFLKMGIYDISALSPHFDLERKVIVTLKNNAIQYQASDLDVPELMKKRFIKRGFELYRQQCEVCHGAPGQDKSPVGIGLNPNPPPLLKTAENWKDAEIAWIIKNGLKMAGMPGFGIGKRQDDLWSLTAFVKRMNTITPKDYEEMIEAEQSGDDSKVAWAPPEDKGHKRLKIAHQKRGKALVKSYGCVSCHVIPGALGPQGRVGPSLENWKHRHFIAGKRPNYPQNLVHFLIDPESVSGETLMPHLHVKEKDAWDMAKFLYSIEE